jgi:hypothetical protein
MYLFVCGARNETVSSSDFVGIAMNVKRSGRDPV